MLELGLQSDDNPDSKVTDITNYLALQKKDILVM